MKKTILLSLISLCVFQNIIQADTVNQNLINEFNVYYNTRLNVIRLNPGSTEHKIIFLTGIDLYKNKHYANALKRFLEIAYRYPNSEFREKATVYIAKCYIILKQYIFAEKEISLYLSQFPQTTKKGTLLFYKGIAAKKEGRIEAALIDFKNCFESSNQNRLKIRVALLLARIFVDKGDKSEALKYTRAGLKITPETDELNLSRFKLLEKQIRWQYLMNNYYKDRSIAAIYHSADKVYILTYINGIAVYERSRNTITERHDKNKGLRSNLVRFMAKVKEDYWVSTYSGLSIYKASEKRWIKADENAPNNTLKTIEVTTDEVWVATLGEGLFRYDLKTGQWQNFNINNGAPGIAVVGLKMDENKLWVATLDGGIGYYNKTTGKWKKFHSVLGERARNIKCIEANQNFIFCGTFKHGLFVYDKRKKTWKNYTTDNSKLTSNNLLSMKLNKNRLYIGTYNGGVTTIDLSVEWQWGKITVSDGLPSMDVTCIEIEGKFIWFGTINFGVAVYLEDN